MKKHRYVLGFLFDDARERVVLLLKTHPEWQKGWYNGLGGKIENGESPIAAMRREAIEEANCDVKWEHYHTLSGGNYSVRCYRAFNNGALESIIPMTDEKPLIVDLCNLPRRLVQRAYYLIMTALKDHPNE